MLTDAIPDLSRTRAQALIKQGLVSVDGRPSKANSSVPAGSEVIVQLKEASTPQPSPEPIALDVLYEDEDVLVIDKPPGLVVHPSPGHRGGTLVDGLLAAIPEIVDAGEADRPGIVHRLDRDTSGVMIVAKNDPAKTFLTGQFEDRSVEKHYLGFVEGILKPDHGAIEAPIGRDSRNRQRMAVVHRGRSARTDYAVVEHFDRHTLVDIRPLTGRTHQIRVHFSAIKHPIVGDRTYGQESSVVERQFLHASSLSITLPSGDRRQFDSPLRADLEMTLVELRRGSGAE